MTYNLKRAGFAQDGLPVDVDSEFDSPKTIDRIVQGLKAGGHTVYLVEATHDFPRWFLTHPVDMVFNIAEGIHGEHRESQVPAVLESLGVPFTGSNSVTLALALDKAKTKQILASEGIPTPAWQLFHSPTAALNPQLEFPLIVKPNREGSAKGIWRESVVGDEASLRCQIAHIYDRYQQEVLVEEFIQGLELTVGVLGDTALPVLEIDFSPCRASGEYFYSWRMKEFQGNAELALSPEFYCPARLDQKTAIRIQELTLRAHHALRCQDISRTDIRLRSDGIPFVLEVNPLPGLDPLDSNFPVMARAAGFSHERLIQRIVDLAICRFQKTRLQQSGCINPPVVQSTPFKVSANVCAEACCLPPAEASRVFPVSISRAPAYQQPVPGLFSRGASRDSTDRGEISAPNIRSIESAPLSIDVEVQRMSSVVRGDDRQRCIHMATPQLGVSTVSTDYPEAQTTSGVARREDIS